jgi:hypothetical protein
LGGKGLRRTHITGIIIQNSGGTLNLRRTVTLVLAGLAFVVFVRATCGPRGPVKVTAEQQVKFTDHVFFHNAGITYDGRNYYTVNGGNDEYCQVNKYTKSGKLVETSNPGLDGRAICYNPAEEAFYVKPYGTSLYEVDLGDEGADEVLEEVFSADQSSPGFSPDGERIYEFDDGTVTVFDFDGEELSSFEVEDYYDEGLYPNSIAASNTHVFVWADTDQVGVYTREGDYVTTVELPFEGYAMSLSWCNGMLWVAKDADGSTDGDDGYWYGYKLKGLN